MKVKHWQVVVEWRWGGAMPWGSYSSFKESWDFTIKGELEFGSPEWGAEYERQVEYLIDTAMRRLAFDCGRLDQPLTPTLCSAYVTAVTETYYLHFGQDWDDKVKAMVEDQRRRIQDDMS